MRRTRRLKLVFWIWFCSAGVPPAGFSFWLDHKPACGTPALQDFCILRADFF